VLAAFAHAETDRVPVDLGATASSTLEPAACAALRDHLGLAPDESLQALDELLDILDPDLGRVRLGGSALWDGYTLASPLAPTLRDLERVTWPDATDRRWLHGLREQTARQRARGRAVVLDTELGLVDGCQRLRGMTRWLEDLLSAPMFAAALMERVTWVCAEILRNALQELEDAVDAVVIYEDMAGQTRTLMSPALYRTRIKPFHAALVEAIHVESHAKAVFHCDGAVVDLLPDLVEIGIDGLNPVQTSARGMEPRLLKQAVGRDLCLWGGCDASWALAFGAPTDIEAEARGVLDALAPGGGYIFGPVHPIDAAVPPENILALLRAAKSSRGEH
jgi:uroporphyrinogen decarboxylase